MTSLKRVPVKNLIGSIKASSFLCPLYEYKNERELTAYYTVDQPAPVWENNKFPVTVAKNVTFNVQLGAGANILPAKLTNPPFAIDAKLERNVPMFSTTANTIADLESNLATLPLTVPMVSESEKPLPWLFSGRIYWTIRSAPPSEDELFFFHDIEIYVLDEVPPYFDTAGIPLDLLRLPMMQSWMSKSESISWPAYVINTIFNDTRLTYETYTGGSAYFSSFGIYQTTSETDKTECWLDLWLNDYKHFKGESKLKVNCSDLASLCHCIISLGISKAKNLELNVMEPFGYIQPTLLIGRQVSPSQKEVNPKSQCNNPMYGSIGYSELMLMLGEAQISPSRSGFSRHVFLTMDDDDADGNPVSNVYDATCGPQIGNLTVDDYLRGAIDNVNAKRLKNGTGSDIQRLDLKDIISSRCFERILDPTKKSESILYKLHEAVTKRDDGVWYQPYIACPVGQWKITATWTFGPRRSKGELYTVNLIQFEDEQSLVTEYQIRIKDVTDWWKIGDDHARWDSKIEGGFQIYASRKYFYLLVIRSDCISQHSQWLVDLVVETVDKFMEKPKNVKNISPPTISPAQSVHRGDTITVTLTVRPPGPLASNTNSSQFGPETISYWRGFNVQVPTLDIPVSVIHPRLHIAHPSKVVLLLDCVENETMNTVVFRFLARNPGEVTVIISMYGGNLEVDKQHVKLTVAKAVSPTS